MEAFARNASAFGDLHARLTFAQQFNFFLNAALVSAVCALPH
jgi:hypothetical protein